ncbi:MAG: lysylphosphatidylglycerol synthase transmembrane domain-containing protein [Phycicoccus sp.]
MTGRRLRALGGAVVLGAVLLLAGPDAVPEALGSVDAGALLAGAAIGALTTTCAAWRWWVVAGHLGARISLPAAVAGCYRAQFLNATLPGGVLGDVGRGVGHGRAVGDLGRGLRAVAWERTCGYVVLAVVTGAALLVTGASRVSWPALPWWVPPTAVAAAGGLALAGSRRLARPGLPARMAWPARSPRLVRPPRLARLARGVIRTTVDDLRALATPRAVSATVAASLVVVAGHVATFVLAARVVGAPLDVSRLVPVALVVLLVGALPLNLAGWGPREGAAAWAFAGAGSDASQGLAVAVVYAVVSLVATLPGAVLLALETARAVPDAARARSVADTAGAAGVVGAADDGGARLGAAGRPVAAAGGGAARG